jgi:hypothetical protein
LPWVDPNQSAGFFNRELQRLGGNGEFGLHAQLTLFV